MLDIAFCVTAPDISTALIFNMLSSKEIRLLTVEAMNITLFNTCSLHKIFRLCRAYSKYMVVYAFEMNQGFRPFISVSVSVPVSWTENSG